METPRTNKNAGYYYGYGIQKNSDLAIDPNGPFVLADFARELERENNRLKELLQASYNYIPANAFYGDILNKSRDEVNLLRQVDKELNG